VDPLLTALGIELAAGAILDIPGALARWAKRDEVQQLLVEIDKRFGEVPGLSATGLAPLGSDPEFLQLLAIFFFKGAFPRDNFVDVIEPHVGGTAELTPRQVAEQIADAIHDFGARARADDRELFAIEVLREDLRRQHDEYVRGLGELRQEIQGIQQIRHVSAEWAPPLARAAVRRLVESDPAEVAPLQDALEGRDDPRRLIEGLINDPPPWLNNGSHKRWSAVGEVASAYGLWSVSADAFLQASERPGANRAGLIARAAADSLIAGNDERYEELLARAEGLDRGDVQVILSGLRTVTDPAERLGRLEEAPKQEEPRHETALAVARAVAQLDLGMWDEAEATLATVAAADPDHLGLRELQAALVISRNRERAARGESVDLRSLREAAEQTLALRTDLLASFRFGEAGQLLARASEALSLADDRPRAVDLLRDAQEEERSDREAALALVAAALTAGAPELARRFAPEAPATERERLASAEAGAFSEDVAVARGAVPVLDDLLKSDDPSIRGEAAFARQVAALTDGIDSSEPAQRLLREEAPALAALLEAERLKRAGDTDAGERLLLPHHDDTRVLRSLVRWAGQRRDWRRVLELSRAIVQRDPSPEDRLIFADALRRTGSSHEALTQLVSLRRDENVPQEIRTDAFATSAQIVSDAFDYSSLEAISGEWLEFDSEDSQAGWARVWALLRLMRPAEALALAGELGLEPRSEGDAHLLAAALDQASDPLTAATEIADLSDRFDRPERLEAHFLITALRIDDRADLGEFGEQIRERMATFAERFPDSRIIWSVPVDTTPEGIERFFREHVAPGAEHAREIATEVGKGNIALAALAGTLHKPLSRVTLELDRGLPLAYQDPLLSSLERESADAAVGRAAVWDPVALAVVATLPRAVGEKVRLALPASVVAQATLDDVARTGEDPAAGRSEYSVIGFDPETERGWIREYAAEDVEQQLGESLRAVEITRMLNVRPDVEAGKPSALDQFLVDEDREPAFAAWPATLAVAERDQLPVYSDDRFVRAHARRAGIQSFGTLALLDALSEAGHLSSDERQQVRELLLARGAHGVAFTLDELLREARAADWSLTPSLAFALTDPTNWGQKIAETFRLWSAFLRAAFDEAQEEQFRMWVLRFLDTARMGLEPRGYGFVARALLMVAWEPFKPERRPFLHALIRELRAARSVLGWFADPLAEAARNLNAMMSQGEGQPVRALLARALLEDVPFEDQLMLLSVRPPWK
jgi:hypothetical protein